MFLSHFECVWYEMGTQFCCLLCSYQLSPTLFTEEAIFFPVGLIISHLEHQSTMLPGFNPGISVLVCWPTWLSAWPALESLKYLHFQNILKSRSMVSLILFFLKVTQAILSLLWYHMNFRIVFSSILFGFSFLLWLFRFEVSGNLRGPGWTLSLWVLWTFW